MDITSIKVTKQNVAFIPLVSIPNGYALVGMTILANEGFPVIFGAPFVYSGGVYTRAWNYSSIDDYYLNASVRLWFAKSDAVASV